MNRKLRALNCAQTHKIKQNPVIDSRIAPDWFDPHFWIDQQAVCNTRQGRHTTYFVQQQQHTWVLRHYYRGGLIAKWLTDHYFFLGFKRTRSIAEYDLLLAMRQRDLPVPRPIAAYAKRQGLMYQADILIECLEGYQDLHAWLSQAPLPMQAWQTIGETIARFHLHKIHHPDLNLRNILWNGEQAYLIDFDQAHQKWWHGTWQQRSLARLERSFKKGQAIAAYITLAIT